MVESLTVPGLEAAWLTHRGRVRDLNEDAGAVALLPNRCGVLLVLSDGMGAQAGGEVASRIVCDRMMASAEVLRPECSRHQWYAELRAALLDANRLVHEASTGDLRLTGMGATALVAAVTPTDAIHLYAGDSRLYHFRQGTRLYRTQDHSVAEVLHRVGQIQESDMRSHPKRNLLLSFLGRASHHAQPEIEPKWKEGIAQQDAHLALSPGDVLFLCTDGVHGLVAEQALAKMACLVPEQPAADVAAQLLDAALEAGGTDNVTVAVVHVLEL